MPYSVLFPTALDTVASLGQVSNDSITTSTASINDSATSIAVTSTTGFPNSGHITLNGIEHVYYTSKDATHFLGLTRGQDGSSASSHASGIDVESKIIAIDHNILNSAIRAIETKLGINDSTPATGLFLKATDTGESDWTAIDAADIQSGTIALARISGITNTQISNSAAIAWSKLDKTGSSLNDLTTKSAADLSSGTLADARLSSNVPLKNGTNTFTGVNTLSAQLNANASIVFGAAGKMNFKNSGGSATAGLQNISDRLFVNDGGNGTPGDITMKSLRVVKSTDTSLYVQFNGPTGGNSQTYALPTDYPDAESRALLGDPDGTLYWGAPRVGTIETLAMTYTDASGLLVSTDSATDGQILIGVTGDVPILNTITPGTGVDVTNGAGSITVKVADTAVTPGTYGTAVLIPRITVDQQGRITAITTNTLSPASITVTGTSNQISVANGNPVALGGTVTLSTPQDIGTSSSVTFGNLTLPAAGVITWTGRSKLKSDADGSLLFTNNAGNSSGTFYLNLGGLTSSFNRINSTFNLIAFELADGSGYSGITAQQLTTPNDGYVLTGATIDANEKFALATDGFSPFSGGLTLADTAGVFFCATDTTDSPDLSIIRSSAGILGLLDGSTGGGVLEFKEITAPSAGAANTARLYAKDDGSGNTQLAVKFFGGTEKILSSNITSLNGLTAASQTFANDTNVTMVSATSTHTITWSGSLSIARGGTGQTSKTAAFDALSPLTTKGDLIYFDGSNNVRLALGSSARYLRSDGTDASWSVLSASDLTTGTLPLARLVNITTSELSSSAGITVPQGGTGAATFTSNGVLYGNSTSAIQVTAQASANSILVGNAGAPSFSQTPLINTSVQIGVVSSQTGSLKLANSSSSNLTTIQAGNASNATTYIWPADEPDANAYLKASAPSSHVVTLSWDGGHEGILATVTVDASIGTKQTLYTVPTGKHCVVTKVIARSAGGSFATSLTNLYVGFNAGAFDYTAYFKDSSLTNLLVAADTIQIANADGIGSVPAKIGAAGDVFGCLFDENSLAQTLVLDVFGYLY